MTEMTDRINIERGVIFFDGACGVCRGSADRFGRILRHYGFSVWPLQSEEARRITGASVDALLKEVHLVTASRQVLRGVDAILYIAAIIPWLWPLRWLAALPGTKRLLGWSYRAFAQRRYRLSRACRIGRGFDMTDALARWVPGLLLVAIVAAAGRFAVPWVWMWGIAISLFLACKWATWWPARRLAPVKRNLAYFLAWTGMDAESFLAGAAPPKPAVRDWFSAIAKALSGAAMIWIISRLLWSTHPTAAAWIGMFGVALLLHFGLMHLIALAWRRAGVAAEPLMRSPARSTSLAEFWGRRWNTGFRFLAYDLLFRPLARPLGIAGATAVVFVISGIIHDAVISIPARGGYGLPTLFFLLQLVGVQLERTRTLKRGLRHPLIGWLYVVAFTVLPMPLLFHAAFMNRVVVPFLHAIGGLS